MLRSSSLIPPNPKALDLSRQLTWGRVRRFPGGVSLVIKLEKTIQFREREHHVSLAAAPYSVYCPVAALDTLVHITGAHNCKKDDLVFRIPDIHGVWQPLVKYQYLDWFKMRVEQMGLPADKYHLHGFRRGAIQETVLVEPNLEVVKVNSNHLSLAVTAYTNLPAHRRFHVNKKVIDSMSAQTTNF